MSPDKQYEKAKDEWERYGTIRVGMVNYNELYEFMDLHGMITETLEQKREMYLKEKSIIDEQKREGWTIPAILQSKEHIQLQCRRQCILNHFKREKN